MTTTVTMRGTGEALGARLGAIGAVRDAGVMPPQPRAAARAFSAATAEAIAVEPGEQQVAASVEVEFLLEQS